MRHKVSRRRLNQKPDHARLLQRNLVTSLVLYEEIRTTKKRAQVIGPLLDSLITTAKSKDAHNAIRMINAFVTDKNASKKLMEVLSKRYEKRPGGFTRYKAVGARKGDGAELVDLSLVDAELVTTAPAAAKKTEKKAPAKKATTASKKADDTSSSDTSAS